MCGGGFVPRRVETHGSLLMQPHYATANGIDLSDLVQVETSTTLMNLIAPSFT